jgi:amidohydrolase
MSNLHTVDVTNSSAEEEFQVLPEVFELFPEMVENRRWFHAHPEIGFEEHQTAAKIAEILKSYGIESIHENIAKTGIVAVIHGGNPGPCIALRADIDALPLTETAEVDYKSQNNGFMHACGHDGHITGLLATAKLLWKEREHLHGTVKIIFQPAEEGFGGAKVMIEENVLEEGKCGPRVDEIFGIHLWSCK